ERRAGGRVGRRRGLVRPRAGARGVPALPLRRRRHDRAGHRGRGLRRVLVHRCAAERLAAPGHRVHQLPGAPVVAVRRRLPRLQAHRHGVHGHRAEPGHGRGRVVGLRLAARGVPEGLPVLGGQPARGRPRAPRGRGRRPHRRRPQRRRPHQRPARRSRPAREPPRRPRPEAGAAGRGGHRRRAGPAPDRHARPRRPL
ncbi:MAG: hypothetical protein AVDCRST_MAG35-2174, partial [uncultured Quadrisphaera sp.]